MIWYKSWLDTRWRFLLGLAVLVVMACSNIFEYGQVQGLLSSIDASTTRGGPIGRALAEALDVQQTYRGYVWFNWFSQGIVFTLFAALLGSGSPFLRSGQGMLFMLALPVARGAWVRGRAAVGLAQLFAFAIVPALVFPTLSGAIGEQYGLAEALVHGGCVFVTASVFFALASLLSAVFNDLWRPLLITFLIGTVLSFGEATVSDLPGPFAVMSAESYFDGGPLPWLGLLLSAALATVFLYGAAKLVERRDF
jgi:hypothetical protein